MLIRFILVFLFFSVSSYASNFIRISNGVLLERVDFNHLPNWNKENYKEAIDVFLDNCNKMMNFKRTDIIAPQISVKINKDDFYAACRLGDMIKHYNQKYLKFFFESYFVPYKIVDLTKSRSLFTGYYMPLIRAKRNKDNIFRYPIYRRPYDLQPNKKYFTRRQINNGALKNKNLEILYTDDFVDLFFLHIQGSGHVYLVDENRIISIGFDGKNNHKYTSIGKYMIANKLTKSGNSKDLKRELKQKNFNFVNNILNMNDSYVFFKIIKSDNHITGAYGTKLVPYRTLAVDTRYIPLGFPLWVNTTHNTRNGNKNFSKFMIANDTGSAIKGVVRGDIFFGSGVLGEDEASYQYSSGEYYLLLPERAVKKLK